MAEFITYEGIGFNKNWVASKSLKEFSEHEKHHGLSPEQYKEVHDLCTGKVKEEKKEDKAVKPTSDKG
jgi:hypothetical protein